MSENQKAPGRGSPPGMPRWVKLVFIIFIVLIAAVVVMHLMGFDFSSHGAINNTGSFAQNAFDYSLLTG